MPVAMLGNTTSTRLFFFTPDKGQSKNTNKRVEKWLKSKFVSVWYIFILLQEELLAQIISEHNHHITNCIANSTPILS